MFEPGQQVMWEHRPYAAQLRPQRTLTGTVIRSYQNVCLIAVEVNDGLSYYLVEHSKLTLVETGEE